jgi:hypothetical protein
MTELGIKKTKGTYSTVSLLSGEFNIANANICFGADGFHTKGEYWDSNVYDKLFPKYVSFIQWAIDENKRFTVDRKTRSLFIDSKLYPTLSDYKYYNYNYNYNEEGWI